MTVQLENHDGWAEIVLDRPARRNAINGPLAVELGLALAAIEDDERIQAVLLRGAGGAFCSGLDLDEFSQEPRPEWFEDFRDLWRVVHVSLFECRVPIIGALERFAINGGAALALACDVLVAGETAYLQVGEVQQGMAAPYNLAWLRLRHSEAMAARLALLGERWLAPELERLGFAVQVVPDAAVVAAATEYAEALADYPPGATERIKAGLRGFAPAVAAEDWFDRASSLDPLRPLAPRAAR